MRYLILIPFLMAFTPLYNEHESQVKVDAEFKNVAVKVQDKSFAIVNSTPNLTDFQDGEFRIFQATVTKIMFRAGQEIYAVTVSCITVKR